MKEADWHDLCRREHEQGGEVTGITLTRRSAQELASEVLGSPEAIIILSDPPEGQPTQVVAGGWISHMLNQVTRQVIEVVIDLGAEADAIVVRCGPGGSETRTVILGAA